MRIGIDARFYGSLGKGLGRYTEKLITGLSEIDRDNEYFIFLREDNFAEYRPASANFHPVLVNLHWYSWGEQIRFPWLLSRYRLDLMHFPHFNVPLLYRHPFVVTIHDLILFNFPTVKASELPPLLYWFKYVAYRLVIASAIRRAKTVLTVSAFTKRDIETSFPAARAKIVVAPEAADPVCHVVAPAECALFLRSMHLIGNEGDDLDHLKPFVLYVGNAYPHKNLGLMLDMAEDFPTLSFVLVGKEDYFYRDVRQKSIERGLANVIFTGFVSDRELSVLYRTASVYFFPSLYEGFGLPALEACLYGLPVLAASRGSLPEVLGPAARYFDPTDRTACRQALSHLLDDSAERERLVRAGHERVQGFHWKHLVEQTHTLYLHASSRSRC